MVTEHHTRRVGDRGQVTIPKEIRNQQGISGGDTVEVAVEHGTIVIRKPLSREDLAAAYQRTAERDRRLAREWEYTSVEADQYLGESPTWEE